MKKLWISLAAVALVLALGVTGALAAGHRGQGLRYTAGSGVNCASFTDTDGDGICDNRGTGCGGYCMDADGDGVCDNRGTGCGVCYTDAAGDGICDHYGTGLGSQHHGGHHGGGRNH